MQKIGFRKVNKKAKTGGMESEARMVLLPLLKIKAKKRDLCTSSSDNPLVYASLVFLSLVLLSILSKDLHRPPTAALISP